LVLADHLQRCRTALQIGNWTHAPTVRRCTDIPPAPPRPRRAARALGERMAIMTNPPHRPALLPLDADAVVWNVSRGELAEAVASRPLVTLMHGFGANERDLLDRKSTRLNSRHVSSS